MAKWLRALGSGATAGAAADDDDDADADAASGALDSRPAPAAAARAAADAASAQDDALASLLALCAALPRAGASDEAGKQAKPQPAGAAAKPATRKLVTKNASAAVRRRFC